MFQTSQLYIVPASLDVVAQLSLLKLHTPPQLAQLFDTPDLLLANINREDGTQFDPLKIEGARSLHTEVMKQPLQHDVRAILIGDLDRASLPAQNALLKLLEEPPKYIRFVLTTSRPAYVLETIHSRCQVISLSHESEEKSQVVLDTELLRVLDHPDQTLPIANVFTLSETYKDRTHAEQFTRTLLQTLHRHPRYPDPELLRISTAALTALQRLQQNGNTRLIIEELLFTFPREV